MPHTIALACNRSSPPECGYNVMGTDIRAAKSHKFILIVYISLGVTSNVLPSAKAMNKILPPALVGWGSMLHAID